MAFLADFLFDLVFLTDLAFLADFLFDLVFLAFLVDFLFDFVFLAFDFDFLDFLLGDFVFLALLGDFLDFLCFLGGSDVSASDEEVIIFGDTPNKFSKNVLVPSDGALDSSLEDAVG